MEFPASSMEFLDKYRLIEPLGEGAMARVFRAVDTHLDRPVAVKVLKTGLDTVERERFFGEARALARLRCRNVLEVLDFGESGGSFYYVMPFVKAVCLADLMDHRRRKQLTFSPGEAAALAAGIARALAEAHRRNVVHRDVKPQNVLTGPDVSVWLTDFGIARDLEEGADLTTAGTVLGTPRYMAPEQILGETVDFSTDLYSLGLVVFELVTGRLPGEVPGDLPATLRRRRDGFEEPLPEGSAAGIALWTLFEGALRSRPARAALSAAEIASGLEALAARGKDLRPLMEDVGAVLGGGGGAAGIESGFSPWTVMGIQASRIGLEDAVLPGPGGLQPGTPASPLDASGSFSAGSSSSALLPQLPRPVARSRPLSPGRPPGESSESLRPPDVQPLARPVRASRETPEPEPPPPPPARSSRVAAAAGLVVLAVAIALASRAGPGGAAIGEVALVRGFERVRIEWRGEARELSLVTPQGHESLYDVRGERHWESPRLDRAGLHAATLLTEDGRQVAVPPFDFSPFLPGGSTVRIERLFDRARVCVAMPVAVSLDCVLRGEGLSVARASSTEPSPIQTLTIAVDPLESATLDVRCRSRLGEEVTLEPRSLPALASAFRDATGAARELRRRAGLGPWLDELLQESRDGRRVEEEVVRRIEAKDLDAPFRDLYPAVGGFLESPRVPLEARQQLYEAIMRLQDVDYLLERSGWLRGGPALDCLPPSWRISLQSQLPAQAETVAVPFDGIMSFKPRFSGSLALYDVMDEISRVEEKTATVELDEVAGIRQAEVAVETWALKPDQILDLSLDGQFPIELRVRGMDYTRALAAKKTITLFRRFDPRLLREGPNEVKLRIRVVPGGDAMDSAAITTAALVLDRQGARGLPGE